MNVKLHTPSTLKAGSGLSSFKQFLLSIVATTISIVLTFGTAAILDHNKKESAKKEMVMMVISDFDQTIEILQKADTVLRKASSAELDLTTHPEHFDSLQSGFIEVVSFIIHDQVFPETTEKIFTTSIETFNTIGNVNFVNEASSFYITRSKYRDLVQQWIKNDIEGQGALVSVKSLFNINFPEYVYLNWSFMGEMKEIRDRCMLMMNVSEKDLKEFSQQQTNKSINPEKAAQKQKMQDEMMEATMRIMQASENLKE